MCIPFLTGGVPDLGFDEFAMKSDRTCLKLDTNGGFWIKTELVLCKTWKELRFPDSRVTDHHHFEYVIDLLRQRRFTYVFIGRRLSAHLFVHYQEIWLMTKKALKFFESFLSKWEWVKQSKEGEEKWSELILFFIWK